MYQSDLEVSWRYWKFWKPMELLEVPGAQMTSRNIQRVIVDEDLLKYCQKTFKKYGRIRLSIFAIFWKVLVKFIFCHISGTSEDIESILVAIPCL